MLVASPPPVSAATRRRMLLVDQYIVLLQPQRLAEALAIHAITPLISTYIGMLCNRRLFEKSWESL